MKKLVWILIALMVMTMCYLIGWRGCAVLVATMGAITFAMVAWEIKEGKI